MYKIPRLVFQAGFVLCILFSQDIGIVVLNDLYGFFQRWHSLLEVILASVVVTVVYFTSYKVLGTDPCLLAVYLPVMTSTHGLQ